MRKKNLVLLWAIVLLLSLVIVSGAPRRWYVQYVYINDTSSKSIYSGTVINYSCIFYQQGTTYSLASPFVNTTLQWNSTTSGWVNMTSTITDAVYYTSGTNPTTVNLPASAGNVNTTQKGNTVYFRLPGTYYLRCYEQNETANTGFGPLTSTVAGPIRVNTTCNYTGSGNWNINCAENCVYNSNQTISNQNNVTITGSGNLTFNSGGNWTFKGSKQNIFLNSGCTLNIKSGGRIS